MTPVTMVTGYDIIGSMWLSHFESNRMFFQLLLTIKSKLVDKMMQSTYIYVLFYISSTRNHQILPFIPDF